MLKNLLSFSNRAEFRAWLMQNAATQSECYLLLKRGKPKADGAFYYLDGVEEALCFGWIDSTLTKIGGENWQRFTPRAAKSNWTELNKARVRRLEALGLMTDAGRAVLPEMTFTLPKEIETAIRAAGLWEAFTALPPLYQRVRGYNLSFTKKRSLAEYEKAFAHFAEKTAKGETYGAWDDYGRLTGFEE